MKKFFALVSQMGILVRYHVQTNRYYPKNYFLIIIFLIMTSFHSITSQNEKENEYVLIINSYTESTPWSRLFTAPVYEQMATVKILVQESFHFGGFSS